MEKHIIGWWQIPYMSQRNLAILQDKFGDFATAWNIENKAELWRAGLPLALVDEFWRIRPQLDLDKLYAELIEKGVKIITKSHPDYPPLLKEIDDAPFALFVLGNLKLEKPVLAVVGTRKPSDYGLETTRVAVECVAQAGVPVISGLAFGIDAAAHQTCLKMNAPTIGVLASGILDITPRAHQGLAREILAKNGAIISEYPHTLSEQIRYRFIERNRLIAGIAKVTFVAEAPIKSGAIHTAEYALESGRTVIAVPGEWTRLMSQGCNRLVNHGAKIFEDTQDLILALGIAKKRQKLPNLQITHRLIWEKIKAGARSAEEVSLNSGISIAEATLGLIDLEILGLLKKDLTGWEVIEK